MRMVGLKRVMIPLLFLGLILPSCAPKRHCPGVSSTGNYKPHVKNRKEDGLVSAKMVRQMNKAKKADPVEGKKLQFPQ